MSSPRATAPALRAVPTATADPRRPPRWVSAALDGAPAATSFALTPGERIPGTRYVVIRWLGDGGMGVVYAARHLDLERRVALKVLRARASESPTAARMFRDEARAASRIGSPYIVEVFDFAELPDGRLMFAMELLEGRTLAEELRAEAASPERTIGILRQICKGLEAAHRAGVIHRDVKPSNVVLVRERGRPDRAKLVDFGVAAILDDDGRPPTVTGTPYYIAPELILGEELDARADVYGLGCTAYEMLTGRTWVTAERLDDVLNAHLQQAPRPPSEVAPEAKIPVALERVVLKAISRNPAERYADMNDFEAALCEAQIASGLVTPWDDLPLPEVDPVRRDLLLRSMPDVSGARRSRRRWAVTSLVVASLALGAGGLYSSLMREPAPAPLQQNKVDRLAARAESAAARALFVYPLADDPSAPTAYSTVLEIEAIRAHEADAARERGRQLRDQYADTLVRLGDQYWAREGGRGFAVDYYVQALLFRPQDEHAAARAILSPGQMAVLEHKAAAQEFTPQELIAFEPLQVLAEPDEGARLRKLEQMSEHGWSRSTAEVVRRLVAPAAQKPEPKGGGRDAETTAGSSAHVEPSPSNRVELANDGEGASASEASGNEPQSPTSKRRDPASAARLARQGHAALRAGDLASARESFEKALASDSRQASALIGLSAIAFNRSAYGKAAKLAAKAVRLAPHNAEYRITLGDAYYKTFRYSEATEQYAQAMRLGHPDARRRHEKARSRISPGGR